MQLTRELAIVPRGSHAFEENLRYRSRHFYSLASMIRYHCIMVHSWLATWL